MDSPLRILNGPVNTAPSDNEDGDKMDIENHNDDGMESEDGIGDVAEKKSEEVGGRYIERTGQKEDEAHSHEFLH